MATVAVTGSSGTLGRAVVRELLDHDWWVVALWGYVDARDGAQAVRKALEYGDTVVNRANDTLLSMTRPAVSSATGRGTADATTCDDQRRGSAAKAVRTDSSDGGAKSA
jgi:nucleoside-diphosphate-sugar epimerase